MAIRTTYKYKCDLDKGTLETSLRNSLMQADALADTFAVTVQRNGADVDIGGMTVYGYLYASATKTTALLKGTVSGSTATVVLSEDCYAVPGHASLAIQLHDGDVRHTVLKVDFIVTRTGGTLVLDGDNILPTLAELLGQISAMEQATAEAREATQVANQAAENVEAFKGEIQGDIDTLTEENANQQDEIYNITSTHIGKFRFGLGRISDATGEELPSTTRAVSGYIRLNVNDTFALTDYGSYKYVIYAYNQDKSFATVVASVWLTRDFVNLYGDRLLFRIVIAKTDDTAIDDVDALRHIFIVKSADEKRFNEIENNIEAMDSAIANMEKPSVSLYRNDYRQSIRLMTHNVGLFNDGSTKCPDNLVDERKAMYKQLIAKYEPDIIFLQEAPEYMNVSNTVFGQSVYDYRYTYYDGSHESDMMSRCITSNYPLMDLRMVSVSGGRSRVKTYTYINGVKVALYNVHLGLTAEDRAVEIQSLLNDVTAEPYFIIGGDFNAEMSELAGFVDAGYVIANRGEYVTDYWGGHIDNFIMSANMSIKLTQVESGIFANMRDHSPLICTITVGNTANIPATPTTDGTYTLKATVTNGVITYEWVSI